MVGTTRWGCGQFLIASLLVLLALPVLAGETKLSFDVGWGDHTRPGAWTPIYVEVTDPKPRNAILEYSAPYDSGTSIKIRQPITVGSQPGSRYMLLAPLVYSWNDPTVLRVRDAETGKLMAEEAIMDQMAGASDRRDQLFMSFLGPYIGTSGRGPCLQQVTTGNSGPMVGFLRPLYLPRAAEGYAALEVVVLNQPDFNTLEIDQQKALLDWVRCGGHLVLWPSEDPVPPLSPLVASLPCKIGDVVAVTVAKEDLSAAGLPARFGTFKARELKANPGATTIPLLGKSAAAAVRGRIGIGHVTVVSFDASGLNFNSTADAQRFWGLVLNPRADSRNNNDTSFLAKTGTAFFNNQSQDPNQAQAASQVMDLLGDVPGVGAFGFGYVAIVLLGMMAIVGPVDWFILKKLGRQPWTWVTTSGWVLAITFGAISIGSFVRSGDLHFRTLRVVDQADDRVFARQDVVGIYSPRTTDYKLETPDGGWWRPLSADAYSYGGGGLSRALEFTQSDRANLPEPMTINVWNLRFLKADTYPHDPPALSAKLTYTYGPRPGASASERLPHVTGMITNLAGSTFSHVWIRTSRGVHELTPAAGGSAGVAAKGSLPVDLFLQDNQEWTTPHGPTRYSRYGPQTTMIADSPIGLVHAASGLDSKRDSAVEQLLQHEGGWYAGEAKPDRLAVVYALSEDAPAPERLAEQKPIEKHWQVVRAVVTVRSATAPESTK